MTTQTRHDADTDASRAQRHTGDVEDTDASGKPESPDDVNEAGVALPGAQDRAGVLQGPVHRPRGRADLLRRAVALPGADRPAVAGRPGRPGPQTVDTLLEIAARPRSPSAPPTPCEPIADLAEPPPNAGLALVIGLAAALWSASGYVGAFGRGDEPHLRDRRGTPDLEAAPADAAGHLVTVVLIAARGARPGAHRSGRRAVGDAIGLGSTGVLVWNIAKWPVLLARRHAHRGDALLRHPQRASNRSSAGSAWAPPSPSSSGCSPRRRSASTSPTSPATTRPTASLAGVIVFLLWLWITNLALLFGAELDAELERGRELQAGVAAEEDMQLPPRDTTQHREGRGAGRRTTSSAVAGCAWPAGRSPAGEAGDDDQDRRRTRRSRPTTTSKE